MTKSSFHSVILLFVVSIFLHAAAEPDSVFNLCQYNIERGNSTTCLPFLSSAFALIADDEYPEKSSYEMAEAIKALSQSEKHQLCLAVRQLPMVRHKCCVYFEVPCNSTFNSPVNFVNEADMNKAVTAVNSLVSSMAKTTASGAREFFANPQTNQLLNLLGGANGISRPGGNEIQILGQVLQQLALLLNPQALNLNQQQSGGSGRVSFLPTGNGQQAVSIEQIGGLFGTLAKSVQDIVNTEQRRPMRLTDQGI